MTSATHAGNGQVFTVAKLAEAKRLPVEFLKKLELSDAHDGVSVPYFDQTGAETILIRKRLLLEGKKKYLQPQGVELEAYGLWRLPDAVKAGFLIIVEGESDCWTLWHHGLPALGLPGSGAAKTLDGEYVRDIKTIYVLREPDVGGEQFVPGVRDRLDLLGWQGSLFELSMPTGFKDPSALHVNDPDSFRDVLTDCIRRAKALPRKGGRRLSRFTRFPPPSPFPSTCSPCPSGAMSRKSPGPSTGRPIRWPCPCW
jgi:putative DNA primase/helicase